MDNSEQEVRRQVRVEWHVENVVSKYSTNLLAQAGENEFFLSFFEIVPPRIFSPEQIVESVTAECVARIIVSADKMQSFINAMQDNLNAYLAERQKQESDNESGDF